MRDPPPARRFIDMAFLVAGQQAPRAPQAPAPAPADYQQPPSSQAPGLAGCWYMSGHHKTKSSSCTVWISPLLPHSNYPLCPAFHSPYPPALAVLCALYPIETCTLVIGSTLTDESLVRTNSSAPRQPRLLPALYSAAFQCTRHSTAERTQDTDQPVLEASKLSSPLPFQRQPSVGVLAPHHHHHNQTPRDRKLRNRQDGQRKRHNRNHHHCPLLRPRPHLLRHLQARLHRPPLNVRHLGVDKQQQRDNKRLIGGGGPSP